MYLKVKKKKLTDRNQVLLRAENLTHCNQLPQFLSNVIDSQNRTTPYAAIFGEGQNFPIRAREGAGSRIILRGVNTQESSKKHTKKGKISS